jgi:hypothetical protein
VPDAQFEVLREAGAEDAEIVEALGVMEVFTSFNKFLDTLQVDWTSEPAGHPAMWGKDATAARGSKGRPRSARRAGCP